MAPLREAMAMSDLASLELAHFFSSPFARHTWSDSDELNQQLRQAALAREKSDTGEQKSNVGGWQSPTGRLEWCGAAGAELVRRMYELANAATLKLLESFGRPAPPFDWTLEAWVNVNRPGDFNRTHIHPGSTWSGTYYVDPGEPPANAQNGTALNLFDPCQGRASGFLPTLVPAGVLIRPEAGLMVLFPSYVPHMVFAHRGKRPRISVAFNLRKEPYP
jgi:uncharacterized protein (TIGR02466 family)